MDISVIAGDIGDEVRSLIRICLILATSILTHPLVAVCAFSMLCLVQNNLAHPASTIRTLLNFYVDGTLNARMLDLPNPRNAIDFSIIVSSKFKASSNFSTAILIKIGTVFKRI